jgi:hypothetical protein
MASQKEHKSYIEFELIKQTDRTKKFRVKNIEHGTILGLIMWYGAWRQYAFFPSEETVFSSGCMQDITQFIKGLMEKRKAKPT